MFCHYCGKEKADGTEVCTECGRGKKEKISVSKKNAGVRVNSVKIKSNSKFSKSILIRNVNYTIFFVSMALVAFFYYNVYRSNTELSESFKKELDEQAVVEQRFNASSSKFILFPMVRPYTNADVLVRAFWKTALFH